MRLNGVGKQEVRIGRLLKKIEKLKQQRDHFAEKCSYYANVFQHHKYVYANYESYKDQQKREEINQLNAARVKEQELLIAQLLKERKKEEVKIQANEA